MHMHAPTHALTTVHLSAPPTTARPCGSLGISSLGLAACPTLAAPLLLLAPLAGHHRLGLPLRRAARGVQRPHLHRRRRGGAGLLRSDLPRCGGGARWRLVRGVARQQAAEVAAVLSQHRSAVCSAPFPSVMSPSESSILHQSPRSVPPLPAAQWPCVGILAAMALAYRAVFYLTLRARESWSRRRLSVLAPLRALRA